MKLYQSVCFTQHLIVAGMGKDGEGVNGSSTVTTDPSKGIFVYRDGDTVVINYKGKSIEMPFVGTVRYMIPMPETADTKTVKKNQASTNLA